jgi:hypothetical protein
VAWRMPRVMSLVVRPTPADTTPDDPGADAGARSPGRWTWARLLRRVFSLDVLVCPRCAGSRRILGAVTEPHAVRRLLAALGWPPSRRPTRVRSHPPRGVTGAVCSPTRRGGFRASPLRPPAALAGLASAALSLGRAAGDVADAASGGTGCGGGDTERWLGPPTFSKSPLFLRRSETVL